MRLKAILLLASVLAAPTFFSSAARAQPFQGVYIGAGAGGNFSETITTTRPGSKIETDPGFVGLASIGYGFGNGVRVEIEGNYRQNDPSRVSFGGPLRTVNRGQVQNYGGMFNALFDIDVGSPWVYPYVGAGLGAVHTELQRLNYGQTNFAYQAIAGLSFPVYGVPGLSVTTEYRFLGQNGVQKGSSFTTLPSAPSVVINNTPLRIRQQFDHSLLIGVRYAFNVAPPPPPPAPVVAPAAQPARSYLVFFDWDRADLSDRARQIIKEAADNSTHVSHTKIEVNGYTDTSGTPAYNQRLSVRRAQAVAAELVRDGVPREAIAIAGFGETHLLVPTAAGVREPQNRRVEIIIR
jgi:OOP family OmpA-OmpF porin